MVRKWFGWIVFAALISAYVFALATTDPRPASAQEATISQSWGATVDITAKNKPVTQTLVTSCPEGMYAVAGGWSTQGTVPFYVLESFASQLPSVYGPGQWTETFRVERGALTVTPFVSCLSGAVQLPG